MVWSALVKLVWGSLLVSKLLLAFSRSRSVRVWLVLLSVCGRPLLLGFRLLSLRFHVVSRARVSLVRRVLSKSGLTHTDA